MDSAVLWSLTVTVEAHCEAVVRLIVLTRTLCRCTTDDQCGSSSILRGLSIATQSQVNHCQVVRWLACEGRRHGRQGDAALIVLLNMSTDYIHQYNALLGH